MNMFSLGWIWMYAGAMLMFLELVCHGFVIFFFGLGAATTGLARLALGGSLTLTWQIVLFIASSLVYLLVLRRVFKRTFMGEKATENAPTGELIGRIGKVTERIAPPNTGRVLIGDAEWTAEAGEAIEVGASVKVIAQHNLTVVVGLI